MVCYILYLHKALRILDINQQIFNVTGLIDNEVQIKYFQMSH